MTLAAHQRAALEELARRRTRDSLLTWARAYRYINRRRFSLDRHEYLRALYAETPEILRTRRRLVVMKSTQMGATEWALSLALWMLDSQAQAGSDRTCIYYFPTRSDALDFSDDRMGKAVRQSAYLRSIVSEQQAEGGQRLPASKHLRSVRGNMLYFRGMIRSGQTEGEGATSTQTVDADMVIFDESSYAPRDEVEEAIKRLGHSELKWVVELSRPIFPRTGIDIPWRESDQRYWHLDCGCAEGCCLEDTFPRCVADDLSLACPDCGRPLDTQAGQWIPHGPYDARAGGFHLCQLYSEFHDRAEVMRDFAKPGDKQKFTNHVLGMPYSGSAKPFPTELVLSQCQDRGMAGGGTRTCAGVDVGAVWHVWIGEPEEPAEDAPEDAGTAVRVLWIGTVESWRELGELMRLYDIRLMVMDAMPERNAARDFAKAYPGRVYLAFYGGTERPKWVRKDREVHVDRTSAFDALRDEMLAGLWRLPSAGEPIVREAAEHFDALHIVEQEYGRNKEPRRTYDHAAGEPDHYAHAAGYLRLAVRHTSAARFAIATG